ncbi:transcriptional regulator [Mycolicibacterium conceptionense]|uniref:Transcriptional regulator n=1 Tax=Mycolicibacterium conceptionense TaxID=451644 RepID=A0A0U1CVK3_9MYCO|nr:transcriptional regulator [Mycolicibacterium conceptionense]
MRGASSAPTSRVLDVIELLAGSGDKRLRFSDVVGALNLTQATAHAILKTLCDRGWLIRDPADKTFALGPGLAVVAARTAAARPLAHAARIAAQELSDQLGYAASVVERVADELVITAFEGAGPAIASGTRRRSVSPLPRGTRRPGSVPGSTGRPPPAEGSPNGSARCSRRREPEGSMSTGRHRI